ncbi:hypothetical protein AYI70_g3989 [Smittium culicis]|uniref:Uncharacterized protein n=1 Tax=Smittium culicis TaxID=133412 RepID=A0A1R1Y107_9FUNG|nr:hypothetical protein AYI70_g3989 [Smittium culicis]
MNDPFLDDPEYESVKIDSGIPAPSNKTVTRSPKRSNYNDPRKRKYNDHDQNRFDRRVSNYRNDNYNRNASSVRSDNRHRIENSYRNENNYRSENNYRNDNNNRVDNNYRSENNNRNENNFRSENNYRNENNFRSENNYRNENNFRSDNNYRNENNNTNDRQRHQFNSNYDAKDIHHPTNQSSISPNSSSNFQQRPDTASNHGSESNLKRPSNDSSSRSARNASNLSLSAKLVQKYIQPNKSAKIEDLQLLKASINPKFRKSAREIAIEKNLFHNVFFEHLVKLKNRIISAPIKERTLALEAANAYSLVKTSKFKSPTALMFASVDSKEHLADTLASQSNIDSSISGKSTAQRLIVGELSAGGGGGGASNLYGSKTGLLEYLEHVLDKKGVLFDVDRINLSPNVQPNAKHSSPLSIRNILNDPDNIDDSPSQLKNAPTKVTDFNFLEKLANRLDSMSKKQLSSTSSGRQGDETLHDDRMHDIQLVELIESAGMGGSSDGGTNSSANSLGDVRCGHDFDSIKENSASPRLFKALLVTLAFLKRGRDMVLLVGGGCLSKQTLHILFAAGLLFETSCVYKPLVANNVSMCRVILLKNFLGDFIGSEGGGAEAARMSAFESLFACYKAHAKLIDDGLLASLFGDDTAGLMLRNGIKMNCENSALVYGAFDIIPHPFFLFYLK